KIHAAGDIYANGGWFRVSGGNGLYWESYGPGWYVQDGTWLRTYSNASIWANTGTIATNGSFSAGYGGAAGPAGGAIFSNNVAIGNNSAEQRLEVNGGFIIVKNNGADAGLMSRGGKNYRHHMIGVYPGWATYDVNLAGYNYWNSGPDYTQRIICGGSGSYLGIWASSFNAISSARFKENIQDLPYDHALDAIMHLKPRAYNMVNSQSNAIGFIVEEVLPHIPDAVKYDEKGKAESLDLYALTTVLVKAVQEQEAKIENIERQPIINYGMLLINAHTTYVPFDKSFINQLNGPVPIVTITPVGDDISIYLKEIRTDGFVVAVRDGDNKQANMSWIAVGSADVSNQQDTYQPKMSYQETTQKTLTEGEIENYRNEIRTARDKSLNEKLHTSSTTNTEKPLTYPNNQPADNEAGKGGKPPVFQESSR
ncbi:MAG: tail fiber domain-containing protein, partial [Flavobacteriales bacterium]|nr:tail fiber domain-containing protein [Flavobacteriales bacterium]